METQYDYSEMTEIQEGLLLDIYRWYLEIDDPSQMRFDYTLLAEEGDDLDEFDELFEPPHPDFFTSDLQFENAIFNNFCISVIQFGRYKCQRIIIEQNADPLLVYWKRGRSIYNRYTPYPNFHRISNLCVQS